MTREDKVEELRELAQASGNMPTKFMRIVTMLNTGQNSAADIARQQAINYLGELRAKLKRLI